MIAFGPVPSRRLGHSLGINNIPPKICTYTCVYCQVGKTLKLQVEREAFYNPIEILQAIENKVKEAKKKGEPVDYLTFVPDGEPTLDIHLGKEIELLRKIGVKIAVISNASLIWKKDVRDELSNADWVSLKIDAISQDIWHRINRAHKSLKLDKILQGISDFSHTFSGEFVTETMLIKDINDSTEELKKIANFIAGLNVKKSYIAIPTRPPTEKWVSSPTEYNINMAYQLFSEKSIDVEYLIGYEGNAFAFTKNVEEDLLSITSVHPMREEAVNELLKKAKSDWKIIVNLLAENKLVETKYGNKKFFMRKLPKAKKDIKPN
ncbi:radical SAM protein [candidate division WOR-3 bacterium]|nr:radical SAM protein [candidate division WOR-3 bacterium]